MSIRKPIFIDNWAIDPSSITAITPSAMSVNIRVYVSGVPPVKEDKGINGILFSGRSAAQFLLMLYPYDYQQGCLPDWMTKVIEQLSKEQITQFLRDRGDLNDSDELDLDAVSEQLCNQIETELNNPVEVSESELEQMDKDYDDMPW